MAGIGFQLQNLMDSNRVMDRMRGSLAALLLASGGWIFTIAGLASIGFLYFDGLSGAEQEIFRCLVNYAFCFSSILANILEPTLTRYVADRLYERSVRDISLLMLLSTILLSGICLFAGGIFCWFAQLTGPTAVALMALCGASGMLWISAIFLGCCKDYRSISKSYFIGFITSVTLAGILGKGLHLGLRGFLGGFAGGQAMTAFLLSARFLTDFQLSSRWPTPYLAFVKNRPSLTLYGIFWGIALWIDKIIFWFHPATRERIAPALYKSPDYDGPVFLAILTAIPMLAFFLVLVETKFFTNYRHYLSIIEQKSPLWLIQQSKERMIRALRYDLFSLVVFQLVITGSALILAPQIIALFGFQSLAISIFRYTALATAIHGFLLLVNILILYFDQTVTARNVASVYLLLNTLLTLLTIQIGPRVYGLGFLLAAFIASLLALTRLRAILDSAECLIFLGKRRDQPWIRNHATSVIGLALIFLALHCTTAHATPTGSARLRKMSRWHIQLQNYGDFFTLQKGVTDTVFIIDPLSVGDHSTINGRALIQKLKAGGKNVVFSYLSIGEAEEIRWYWKSFPQSLLLEANPDFPDNHLVKFWEPRWLATIKASLDRLQPLGFDGYFLDVVDAFYRVENPEEQALRMTNLVVNTINHVRSRNPSALFISQNAPCLPTLLKEGGEPDLAQRFLYLIDAQSAESTFFSGEHFENNPYSPNDDVLECLAAHKKAGLPLFGIEYVSNPASQSKARAAFAAHGFKGVLTDRHLKGLRMIQVP